MTAREVIKEWVEQHGELSIRQNRVMHEDVRLGTFQSNGHCSFGRDDGGVKGEVVEVNDDGWLIVDGTQTCYVGEDAMDNYDEDQQLYDGMVEFTGKFAVRPWHPGRPEIDGPLPE